MMIDWKSEQLGENGETLLFRVSGRLDMKACEYLFSVLEDQIQDGHKKLVIDCDDLQFISSVGLGMLMRVHSRMKNKGGDVRLAQVHGAVADVLKLVRLDRVFHIYPTVEAAIE